MPFCVSSLQINVNVETDYSIFPIKILARFYCGIWKTDSKNIY